MLPANILTHMSLEDYIREQERKAKSKLSDARSSTKGAWQKTKEKGKETADDVRDALNG